MLPGVITHSPNTVQKTGFFISLIDLFLIAAVDLPQLFRNQFRASLSLHTAGIIKGNDAPLLPVASLGSCVGVQGQIKVVIAAVGLPDGGGRRHHRHGGQERQAGG